MDEQMFCFQCEQAAHCTACTGKAGVCGKSADTAAAQDRLTGALISYASQLIGEGRAPAPEQALLLMEGLFTTITNVNFDPQTVDQLTESVHAACPGIGFDYDMANLWHEPDEDIRSLKSFVLFSLRGMAAYNYHARVLGRIDPELDRFFCEALQAVGSECSIDTLWALVQKTGKASYRCMELLDAANTGAFGQPEPVEVPLVIEKGPFIVISGHDLYDMKCLLEQTAGKGIHVYTHSEMLPAHGYPELKQKYPHLKGNFGTAWQNQQREFEDIPAPILFTTNCIMPLRESYADRVFTTSVVSYPGVPHIGPERDFSPVIAKALELLPGDKEAKDKVLSQVEDFFRQRIRAILLDNGIAYDIIDAVLAGPVDDIYAIFLKAEAMTESHLKEETDLRQAVTRLANITKGKTGGEVKPELFEEEAEKNLEAALEKAMAAVEPLYKEYRYADALPYLKELTAPINDYLDNVMVMVKDEAVKDNRISQLLKTLSFFDAWGDFSKLV